MEWHRTEEAEWKVASWDEGQSPALSALDLEELVTLVPCSHPSGTSVSFHDVGLRLAPQPCPDDGCSYSSPVEVHVP